MPKPPVYATGLVVVAWSVALAHAQAPSSDAQPLSAAARITSGMMLAEPLFARGDRDADKQLSLDELKAAAEGWFARSDPESVEAVRQDEFVTKFQSLLSPATENQSPARVFALASTALGFFAVVDHNRDASLTVEELTQTFMRAFSAWDVDGNERLDRAELVRGLDDVLPRTNMSGVAGRTSQDPIPELPTPPPSPPLSPEEAMQTIKLVDGFKLELVASEPMIEDPVALSFDEDGRAYVVEMRSYMPDIDRTGEREPVSRITRLEDADGDGRFDRASVFVDGLILPRAVAVMGGGLLYVSDYMLYFAQDTDEDGKADRIELLDADYGRGNVEHAPNGLFRAMDNWMYNGESPYRYRLIGGKLIKQVTEVRGQWGMTQDNYGRLHYNVNNSQLLGDFGPPNYLGRNLHHPSSAGLNLFVATDQRVFPIRMTTAINRGYSPDVLSPDGRAYVFASSCAPLIYRGDNFPAEFVGDAFVADPALNLIKRNVLAERNLTLTSKFAYEDREFLASTDERFRPSNLYNAPDGTIWIVDLYRGIAQYGQFMTEYLRRETLARGLDQGVHFGRIYRIVSTTGKRATATRLSKASSAELVARLSDPNGWIRDTAQRLLVNCCDRDSAAALVRLIQAGGDPIGRIHALWTLEGLFATGLGEAATSDPAGAIAPTLLKVASSFRLDAATEIPTEVWNACLDAIRDKHVQVQIAAIRVTEALAAAYADRQTDLLQALQDLAEETTPPEVLLQAALSAGNLTKVDFLPLLARISKSSAEHRLIREAVMSGLQNHELTFIERLFADAEWQEQRGGRPALLHALASAIIKEREPGKIDRLLTLALGQTAEQRWRQRALLGGVAENVASKAGLPVRFTEEPPALRQFAQSGEAEVRMFFEQIRGLFAWPGHGDESIAVGAAAGRTLTAAEEKSISEGKPFYQQLCAGCHGLIGQGTVPMAPPLAKSEWVLGSEERLVRIALQGVAGPIHVNGTLHRPPNILPEMPGFGMLDDQQIAAVLSYIRRAWEHSAEPVAAGQVAAVRKRSEAQKTPWTEQQLLEIK